MSNMNKCPIESGSGDYQVMMPRKLHVTKVIYNYECKTDPQIRDLVQLEIDEVLRQNPLYKFINSKSHFNGNGGIEMQLNFELK